MLNLTFGNIKRIYDSNIEQKFEVEYHINSKPYNFTMRIGLTIDDIVYVKVEKFTYFNTLHKLIHDILDLVNVKRDSHKIRYKYSEINYISIDDKYELMKIYQCGHTLAEVYLQDDYVTLYEFDKSTCTYTKGHNLFWINQDNISLISADDNDAANKLLEDCKSKILAGINYFNFLTAR